jgi:hypothetical protein
LGIGDNKKENVMTLLEGVFIWLLVATLVSPMAGRFIAVGDKEE